MAITNGVNDTFQTAFESAIQEFRSKLKNDALYITILKTKNIEEVYSVTDKLQEEQGNTKSLRNMAKLGPFLEGLRSYASVIEVFMQAKPDVLSLIWGPIKLILQWADTLKQSMDAIVNTTGEIGDLLPEFQKCTRMFEENQLVADVLVLFFKDILDFYLVTLELFSKSRLKFVFEGLWPRQREKIKIVVNNIQRHTTLLRNEVRLEHIQAEYDARQQALEHFEKSEASYLRQEYFSLRTCLSPRTYEGTLAYLDDESCHEAGLWLIKHDLFCAWADPTKKSTPILWLQGIPGSGKTYLARTVIHETKKKGRALFAFLSYTFSSSISTLSILQSLIFQLSADDLSLQSIVCQSSGEHFRFSVESAQSILKALIYSCGPVFISVDGLDEIEASSRCRILSILHQLSTEIDTLRVMISCRPEADLRSLLDGKCSTIRVNERNDGGIQSYVSQRTLSWYEERDFYPDVRKEMETLLAPLVAKSKGMFLYAKVLLDSIRFLEPDEIMADLKVLPETMNDAYGRILERINNITSPIAKEKARTIIGWIGISPAPLTIHELEQALVIHAQGFDGTSKVMSKLSVVQLCGPIIEVVDDYVRYVHFTVYEFFFCSTITNAIDPQLSRASLAACCIKYLCQHHQDSNIDEDTISSLVVDGVYRLNYYASSFWLKLLEDISLHDPRGELAKELVDLVKLLYEARGRIDPELYEEENDNPTLRCLQTQNPTLYAKIGKSVLFQNTCSGSGFEFRKNRDWADLDPLETSRTLWRVYEQTEKLLHDHANGDKMTRKTLERHYGTRLYKCAYIDCPSRRHGFETDALRRSHEQSHSRPWKCSFDGCEFETGGFLSRKMRDDHLDQFHFQDRLGDCSQPFTTVSALDEGDLKMVCFDLVRADDVATMKEIVQSCTIEYSEEYSNEIIQCAAQFASPEMLTTIFGIVHGGSIPTYIYKFYYVYIYRTVAVGNNLRVFQYLLDLTSDRPSDVKGIRLLEYAPVQERGLVEIMGHGSHEMLDMMCKWIERDVVKESLRAYLAHPKMIAATSGDVYKEQLLLGLWKKLPGRFWSRPNWKNALPNVASTTCSVELANFLLQQNVPVDWRQSKNIPTPLIHATRKTSAAAANLAKLLLFKGASTVVEIKSWGDPAVTVSVSQQKGAQQISQWLGVTWDELVSQAVKAKQHSANLDTEVEAQIDGM